MDEDRQWFKSRVVRDASTDDRLLANPLVTGDPDIRFYAGALLVTPSGNALVTLGVIDREPRVLTEDQHSSLRALSTQVMALLELRRTVHELKKKQEALEEASRQREILIGTVSHELRALLTAIIGFIEFLGEDIDDELRSEILKRLGRQAGDLQHLIDDLRIAARAEADSLNVESVPVRLDSQVALALEDVSIAATHNINVEAGPSRPWPIRPGYGRSFAVSSPTPCGTAGQRSP